MNDLLYQMANDITSMSTGDKMLTAMFVTLVCMMIVFFVLVIIMCIIKILEKFVAAIDKPKEQPTVNTAPATIVQPTVQEEDDSEIVAVITATLQMLQQEDPNANVSHLLVSKISNADTGITLWERGLN